MTSGILMRLAFMVPLRYAGVRQNVPFREFQR
ncbi:Uncharacterised protein [Starkeya nomas]|uniref:Uncharacterized protein n=1 Tax=Starkeya nomas TaxID=2666134 RepID=A0A5S9P5T6_9HYPH|nr:Uncharacterised protein [Starkeya nomas]